MLLSRFIKPEQTDHCIELLLLNGEDYYSTPGQKEYLDKYLGQDNNIILAINCDGIGLKDSKTAVALIELAEEKELAVKDILAKKETFELIDPWVEGDHMLFHMNQIPTMALTSKDIFGLIDNVIHTERDTLELVDYNRILEVVNFLGDLIKK